MTATSYALGIDIGGTSVKVALLAHSPTVQLPAAQLPPSHLPTIQLPSTQLPTTQVIATGQSPPYAHPSASELHAAVAAATPPQARDVHLSALGLCCPGLPNPDHSTITLALNLPALVGVPLRTLAAAGLSGSVPAPALFTDAFAAAFDLYCLHAPTVPAVRGRLLAVSLGTGVGAAVLDDGAPLVITGRGPGHLGQIDVTIAESLPPPLGPDGGRGGLEAYIGLPALLARFGPTWADALMPPAGPSVPVRALVRALRIAHALYRPSAIALLGGVGCALAPHARQLRNLIASDLTSLARSDWWLTFATHAHHAATGAARAALATATPSPSPQNP